MLYCNNANAIGYYIGTTDTPTTSSISSTVMSTKEGYNNTLYYPHQTYENIDGSNDGNSNCSYYWLASPSTRYADLVFGVGYDGYVGGNVYNHGGIAVRPVVSLKSGISGSKVEGVWELGTNY